MQLKVFYGSYLKCKASEGSSMYSPVQDGIEKTANAVQYTEAKPPSNLAGFVHCFWELKTEALLGEDFSLHALPDACVNILFNQVDTQIAGVTALRTTFEVLNLGKAFHYVGIQFFPGVWQGNQAEIADSFVGTPYQGGLPLIETSNALAKVKFAGMHAILSSLVLRLIDEGLVVANLVTEKILTNINDLHTVADMAVLTGISTRQLQRTLKASTGFCPHDLLKVLRLQQSFKKHYSDSYADQSHFIHSFRKITGYTPAKFADKFNV
jgi:AraC-like DNA-binding protein